jgi:hypothetical protein
MKNEKKEGWKTDNSILKGKKMLRRPFPNSCAKMKVKKGGDERTTKKRNIKVEGRIKLQFFGWVSSLFAIKKKHIHKLM